MFDSIFTDAPLQFKEGPNEGEPVGAVANARTRRMSMSSGRARVRVSAWDCARYAETSAGMFLWALRLDEQNGQSFSGNLTIYTSS